MTPDGEADRPNENDFDLGDVADRREKLLDELADNGTLDRTRMRELHRHLVLESSVRAFKQSEMTPDEIADDLEQYADVVRGLSG